MEQLHIPSAANVVEQSTYNYRILIPVDVR